MDFYRIDGTARPEDQDRDMDAVWEKRKADEAAHVRWLSYVLDSDPQWDRRAGDNGWWIIREELEKIPGASALLRCAFQYQAGTMQDTSHNEQFPKHIMDYIRRIVSFYGAERIRRRSKAQKHTSYSIDLPCR